MNLLYRFIIFIIAVLFVFASLVLSIYSFAILSVDQNFLPEFIGAFYGKWELGVLFLILFAASAWILQPFFVNEKRTTIIKKSELGDVDITIDALDSLVNTVALQQEGIIEIKNKMSADDNGLSIFLKAKVIPQSPIPQITENLQLIVKSYIEDTTGVTVSRVKVLVDDVSEGKEKVVE
ncbi:MAG: alkaline shock response membrane anchor protein AmaP [Halothermotrichaceae bacterium]